MNIAIDGRIFQGVGTAEVEGFDVENGVGQDRGDGDAMAVGNERCVQTDQG